MDDFEFDADPWLSQIDREMANQGIDVAALSRREVFHQATGIIMVRHSLDREAAVDFLLDEAELQRSSVDGVARRILDSLTFERGNRQRDPHC